MPETLSQALQGWQNFYLLMGGACATLIGLMFVAITLGSRLITLRSVPALRVFVSPTLIHFLYVLATSLVVLIPTVTRTLLGVLLLLVGSISFVWTLSTLPQMRRSHRARVIDGHDWTWYLVAPAVAYLLYAGTGIALLRGDSQALNGLALASILLLVTGVRNAWDLVVFYALNQSEPPAREPSVESSDGGSGAAAGRPPEPAAHPLGERAGEPTSPALPASDQVAHPPSGRADEPTSLALPASDQAEVARTIQEAGLNPQDFTWAVQPSRYALIGPLVSALVHRPSGCFFRFEFAEDGPGQRRVSVFSPGEGAREVTKTARSWEDQLGHVRLWVKYLRQHRPIK